VKHNLLFIKAFKQPVIIMTDKHVVVEINRFACNVIKHKQRFGNRLHGNTLNINIT
jgi:hypothetical protein